MSEEKNWKYCVVGNIVRERLDENGVLRHGTVAFRGATKVYLEGKNYNPCNEKITVLGLNRFRRYDYVYMPKKLIENVRFSRTYKPKIMDMMYKYEGHDGWWSNTSEDREDAMRFAEEWPMIREMTRSRACETTGETEQCSEAD